MLEIPEVVLLLREADRLRREGGGPAAALATMRERGRTKARRDDRDRRRLHRLISVVDRVLPRAANCYRRALVETAMDAGAASEPFHFGLRAGGGKDSGHAWLRSSPSDVVTRYDAEFTL